MDYQIIDKKTVRQHEKFYRRFKKTNKELPTLVKTNRGYFMDGHHVDQKSVYNWFVLNGDTKMAEKYLIPEPKKKEDISE